jgi:hypothetical protein
MKKIRRKKNLRRKDIEIYIKKVKVCCLKKKEKMGG